MPKIKWAMVKKPLMPKYKKEVLQRLYLYYQFKNIGKRNLTAVCRQFEKYLNGEDLNLVVKEKVMAVSDPDGSKCGFCHDLIFSTMYKEVDRDECTGEIDGNNDKRTLCQSCVEGSIYDELPKFYL